ncbi:hypothetical protein D3C73_1414970 [compost metagenome]
MVQPAEDPPSDRRADHHRTAPVVIGAVTDFGCFADNLISRRKHEIRVLHFGNRLHAIHGCTDSHPGYRRLRQRRIHHTFFPELLLQPFGGGEDTALDANILS